MTIVNSLLIVFGILFSATNLLLLFEAFTRKIITNNQVSKLWPNVGGDGYFVSKLFRPTVKKKLF